MPRRMARRMKRRQLHLPNLKLLPMLRLLIHPRNPIIASVHFDPRNQLQELLVSAGMVKMVVRCEDCGYLGVACGFGGGDELGRLDRVDDGAGVGCFVDEEVSGARE